MIDLHCHILPGLDDGALDIDDSVAMARQAERDGIAVICATPHIRHDHDVRIEEIAERVSALQHQLDAHGVRVRVLPGAEVAASEAEDLTPAQLRLAALGGAGGWVLLEPVPGPLQAGLEALVARLAGRGVRSVIAHPERHAGEDLRERLQGLAASGALIQWTAAFIADAPDGGIVMDLAREGLVHLLGSDAHSSRAGRPVALSAGCARLARVRTPEQMRWTVELAPGAIVRGEPLSPPPQAAPA